MKKMKKIQALVAFKSKVIKPCTKMLSVFIIRINKRSSSFSLKGPRFRAPRLQLRRPRLGRRRHTIRTQVVRFRKPFSIKSIRLPKTRPNRTPKLRLRKPLTLTRKSLRFRRKKRSTTRVTTAANNKRTPTTPPTTNSTTPPTTITAPPTGERVGQRIAELLSLFKSMRSTTPKELLLEEDQVMDMNSISDVGTNGKEPFPSPITPAFVRHSMGSKKDSSDDLEDVEDACRSFENYLVEMIIEEGKLKDLMDVEELLYCWRNLKSPVFVDLVCRFYGELCKDLFSPDEEEEITTPSGPPPSE